MDEEAFLKNKLVKKTAKLPWLGNFDENPGANKEISWENFVQEVRKSIGKPLGLGSGKVTFSRDICKRGILRDNSKS